MKVSGYLRISATLPTDEDTESLREGEELFSLNLLLLPHLEPQTSRYTL
jgi:hypothetical protein